jgi:hypothetical protein
VHERVMTKHDDIFVRGMAVWVIRSYNNLMNLFIYFFLIFNIKFIKSVVLYFFYLFFINLF